MKRSYYYVALTLVFIVGMVYLTSKGDDTKKSAQHYEELGVLTTAPFDEDATYCQYRITEHKGSQGFYKENDIICIVCCEDRDEDDDDDGDPWPEEIQGEQWCWARIIFETGDGQNMYKAERVMESCTECGEPDKDGWYYCPDDDSLF